jgi:signal transduction histidine kinase
MNSEKLSSITHDIVVYHGTRREIYCEVDTDSVDNVMVNAMKRFPDADRIDVGCFLPSVSFLRR